MCLRNLSCRLSTTLLSSLCGVTQWVYIHFIAVVCRERTTRFLIIFHLFATWCLEIPLRHSIFWFAFRRQFVFLIIYFHLSLHISFLIAHKNSTDLTCKQNTKPSQNRRYENHDDIPQRSVFSLHFIHIKLKCCFSRLLTSNRQHMKQVSQHSRYAYKQGCLWYA